MSVTTTPAGVTTSDAALRRPCPMRAARSVAAAAHASAISPSDVRVDLVEGPGVGLVGDQQRVARLDGADGDDPWDRHPGRGRGVQHQGLVLDLSAPCQRRRRPGVAVPEHPPGPRQELRVPGVAAVDGDAERTAPRVDAVVAGDAAALAVRSPQFGGRHPELGQLGGHPPLGGEPGRRTEGQAHRRRDGHPEGEPADHVRRVGAPDHDGGHCAEPRDDPTDVPHRSSQVGRGHHDHRRDEGDPQRRVRRRPPRPDDAGQRRPPPLRRLGDGAADGHGQRGGQDEVTRERPPLGGDRADDQHDHEDDGRAVGRRPQRLEPAEQAVERGGRLGGAGRRASAGERGDEDDHRGAAERDRVVDAPPPGLVPGGREQRVRHRHGTHAVAHAPECTASLAPVAHPDRVTARPPRAWHAGHA